MMFKALSVALVAIEIAIFIRYYNIESYMDEIFHVPQSQQYCQGNFAYWDPKITTFPGLYYVSYACCRLINLIANVECSTVFLRGVNVMLSVILLFALERCRYKLTGSTEDCWQVALLLFVYPINMFYYFLYYTDTLSTTSLVLLYCLSINSRQISPSLFQHILILMMSVLSILARQTNAVWVLFIIGTNMLEIIQHKGTTRSTLIGNDNSDVLTVNRIVQFVVDLWKHRMQLISSTWSLLLPVMGFVVFVIQNGGIVLGDKENHKPVAHWAMLVHMLFIVFLVSLPDTLSEFVEWFSQSETIKDKKQPSGVNKLILWVKGQLSVTNTLYIVVLCGCVSYALVFGSLSHPFLLADNRHYVFYLWKRILSHKAYRIALAPLYCVGVLSVLRRLNRSRGSLWVLIYLIAAAVSLIPTPLLELRYFTPGVVIAILNSPKVWLKVMTSLSKLHSMGLILLLAVVNGVTIYVFVVHHFTWVDGTIARFMY